MSTSLSDIQKQALSLSAAEREQLGETLIASANNQDVTDIDREWIAVAEERYQYLVSKEDAGISESDFFAKLEDRLGWK